MSQDDDEEGLNDGDVPLINTRPSLHIHPDVLEPEALYVLPRVVRHKFMRYVPMRRTSRLFLIASKDSLMLHPLHCQNRESTFAYVLFGLTIVLALATFIEQVLSLTVQQ